ncbi:hypothetical protein IscW_ISCW004996 [Ixodes scapularis]|uniref:Uncharacterized protein n=1 Tax=Ixodes scapularis TaxID=6945 RepID=B7PFW9_IXOSC|nr:hypothetical protein IscW_ISCW004996 [Ixodes scapularis]|eukprot:XP_002434091.1 hypothetical protein IscW_ISCW004996 [Ixodes scapularis]
MVPAVKAVSKLLLFTAGGKLFQPPHVLMTTCEWLLSNQTRSRSRSRRLRESSSHYLEYSALGLRWSEHGSSERASEPEEDARLLAVPGGLQGPGGRSGRPTRGLLL